MQSLADAFPELKFKLKEASGKGEKDALKAVASSTPPTTRQSSKAQEWGTFLF